ncbi:hypothetical protein KFK09_027192 [Dendrobium nobile]|uniref:CGL160/ATPI domain-containing protein n=1 Tax=Dendrobium nobile TaxID=94219 RepID=A0A8T3A8Q1_DENNO|nr:hypothetical protein KFK09_027192 [Dendrobium nobile]
MAVLTTLTSILAVRSAANPASGSGADSSLTQLPSPRLSRVILPKKKPLKWSTGTAPGEYGGPPTTTKLRKYWGGGDGDPLTSTDDFIWNKDFVGHMKRFLRDEPNASSTFPSRIVEQSSGFLSLKRAMSLDSVGIDLSEELRPPPKPVLEQQVEAARSGRSATDNPDDATSPRWRLVPTRREQAKWDRANKAATGGSLKKNLQVLTLGIGGIGVISAYVSYSPEIAASFGAGLIGSLIYIRMLGNTIDSMASGAKGLVKGAVGQPRLLVPVAIVMIYNRWNEILVPDHGFMHLELIPMLVGFFTYKVATLVQAIQDSTAIVEERS